MSFSNSRLSYSGSHFSKKVNNIISQGEGNDQVCPRVSANKIACKNGQFCPEKSTEPRECRDNYYCPNASEEILCPRGKVCNGTEVRFLKYFTKRDDEDEP